MMMNANIHCHFMTFDSNGIIETATLNQQNERDGKWEKCTICILYYILYIHASVQTNNVILLCIRFCISTHEKKELSAKHVLSAQQSADDSSISSLSRSQIQQCPLLTVCTFTVCESQSMYG